MRNLVVGAFASCLAGCFGSSNAPGDDAGASDAAPVDMPLDATPDGAAARDAGSMPDSSPAPVGEAGSPTAFGMNQVTSPQGIAIDPSTGVVWVASFAGGLFKFDANDTYLTSYGTTGSGKISQGAGVALDSKGNVYVGDYGAHDVVELDAAGNYVTTFPAADAGVTLGRVTGVALDANDHLFAIDDDASQVLQFNAAGGVSSQFSTTQTSQASSLAGSVGMHFDASGDLWIADYYYHSFVQYTPAGQLLAQYGMASQTAVAGGFSEPYGLTVDASGNVWVTDAANSDVQEFDAHGAFKALFGASGTGPGQLSGANGIAVDAKGRVLVSDGGNNRIVVFEP
jgi:DNA-binding beta-propeller fold protein YncE